MTTPQQVEALIEQVWQTPFGPGQIALAEDAISRADALGDEVLRFTARLAATTAYQFGGEPAKGFVTFSWCLARFDAHPDLHGRHEQILLWYFKYMIGSLKRFPEVPLARTYAVLDDMSRRYQEGGYSPQAVHKHRWLVAEHIGDLAAEDRYYERWQSAPRDENSDCHGCDPTGQVIYLTSRGRDEEAIALAEPILGGRLTCAEQPQTILTKLLLPYLRTGRLEEARAAHHRAYRVQKGKIAELESIAEHIRFCGVSGNELRGLELIERHLDWAAKAPTPYAEMNFAAASAQVLRRLVDAGQGGQPVRGAEKSVRALADDLARRATTLAARFDSRNASSHQGDLIRAMLTATPIVESLPLRLTAQPGAPRPVFAVPVEPVADPLADVPADADLDLLLDLAEEALRRDQESRAEALHDRIRASAEGAVLTDLHRGRLADLHGMRLHSDAVDETEQTWSQALDWYVQAGDVIREQRIRGRLGLHRCRHGQLERGLSEVRESTGYLLAHGSGKEQAGALRRLAVALLHAEEPAQALGVLDQLDGVDEPDPGPRIRLQVMLLRAQALGADGQLQASVDASYKLVEEAARDGDAELIGLAEFFLGQGLGLMDDPAGAVAAFDRALSHRLPAELDREVRERRAVLLAGTPRAGEVVNDLMTLVSRLAAEQLTGEGDHARFHLAVALFNTDRAPDAAEVAEEALYGADRSENLALADQVRHLLVAIYRRLDEPDQALSYLDQLAVNLDGFDNAESRARVLEQAGELLFELDRDGLAAERFGAAAAAYGVAGVPLDLLRALRRQTLAAMFGSEPDQARDALSRADQVVATLPPSLVDEPECRYELAWLSLDSARALVGIGEAEEALARVSSAPQRFRELESFGEAFLAELTLGEVLLALARPTEAEPVLQAVVNGLPRDAVALPRAAYALAYTLLHLDRADEARRLATEYGFELD